jgi:ATP/maltotriose-dependent transcriptional regulator MalT
LEVLHLIDQGFSNQEIAVKLTVASSTIKTHINNIYNKLGVQTRVQALNRARELGILSS